MLDSKTETALSVILHIIVLNLFWIIIGIFIEKVVVVYVIDQKWSAK